MSGPKTSTYTLTAEQRRILAEQREQERRKAVANECIKRDRKQLLKYSSMFSEEKEKAVELSNRIGNDGGILHKIDELQRIVGIVNSISDPDETVEILEKNAETMKVSVQKAKVLVKEINELAIKNETVLSKNLIEAIDQGLETSFADEIENTKEIALSEITVVKTQLVEKLKGFTGNMELPKEYIEEIAESIKEIEVISDMAFLKNFSSLRVTPLYKKCNAFMQEYEKNIDEFNEVMAEYQALCELHYYVSQEYNCSAESIKLIKAEIERIKAEANKDDEQKYISDCLDEVMEEMGYSVIGSREVRKKNGKHFRNELFTYDEGTAVCVTYSSDGRIAMELGGLDTEDRIPDTIESNALCESMTQFCDDFKEIEKRLLSKGVVLGERISLLPPSADYAQIINATDFEIKNEAENFTVKKQKKKATQTKYMTKE